MKTFLIMATLLVGFLLPFQVSAQVTGIHNVTLDLYYSTIQEAIDASQPGNVIEIAAGNYHEKALGRAHCGSGSDQFGLYIDKNNLTLRGLTALGAPVANAGEVAVNITTEALNAWGVSGIFVEGSGVTIEGIKLGDNIVQPGTTGELPDGGIYNEKSIEVIGNDFTLDKCKLVLSTTATAGVYSDEGQIYIGEMCYELTSYAITNSIFTNANISVNNGAGDTGDRSGRVITGNTFNGKATPYLIGFTGWSGANPAVGWITLPVGGAVISGNTFANGSTIMNYVMAYGNEGGYINSQFDWQTIWNSNTYPKCAVALSDEATFAVRSYDEGNGGYPAIRQIGPVIQAEIDHSVNGDVVKVGTGTYPEVLSVNKSVTVYGAGSGTAINGTSGTGVVAISANGATIRNLTVDNSNAQDGFTVASGVTTLQVLNSFIINNVRYGINFADPGAGNTLSGNTFSGTSSTSAVINAGTAGVAATGNYWGSSKGPALAANPCGDGKLISSLVTYNPWSNSDFSQAIYQLQDFAVSGTATLCSGETAEVKASGSQQLPSGSVYTYILYKNAMEVSGSSKSGTGSALTWSVVPTNGDVFTVKVTNLANACELTLTGSAVMTVNQPVPFTPPTVAQLSATGTALKWYSVATGGTELPSTTDVTNGTTYYASQTVNGVESLNRLAVVANVDATPCAPTGNAVQNFNSGQTVVNLAATGESIRWYGTSTGGTALPTSTVLVTGNYYATQTKQCIESATRFQVAVTVN